MKQIRSLLAGVAAALLLASCGGGDPDVPGSGGPSGAPTARGSFSAVVSFGDSLSDAGSYAPATSLTNNGQAPYFGGRFTTNGSTATVWVENLAASLNIPLTPAQVGFAGTSVACPAAAVPALANSCTAYGQGGARVTNPTGIGKAQGALTVPVVTQIANHLARFSGFHDTDLVLVWGGANDVLIQFQAFAVAAAQIQASATAGNISADEASRQLFAAQSAAQAGVKQAAQELTGTIDSQILAKGGKYVAVLNLPDIADTPLGLSLPSASAQLVLGDLSRLFNLWLNDGLANKPVRIVDVYSLYKGIVANPSQYGFVNKTVPACDAAKISALTGGVVTDGSSLFCNGTTGAPYNGLRAGADPSSWLFADSLHPTTGGHMAISTAITAQLTAFGWL